MSIATIRIADAGKHAGEEVRLAGWLYNLRKSGKIVFPQLRDGTGIMQCVGVKSELPEESFETLKHLTQESSLILTGTVREEQRAPGGYELDITGVEVLQRVDENDPYPDHTERAWRRFPDGPSPSVAAQPAAARHHSRPARGDSRHSRLLRRSTASSSSTRRSLRLRRAKAPRRSSKSITSKTRRFT